MKNNVMVTSPLLPPLESFIPYMEKIWESKKLTNGGPFHSQLEDALAAYLGVEYLSLFANGSMALMTAIQALRITGEVITTPYSFVATSHSLLWNNIKPVFVDVDPLTCNIDPAKIEAAITPATTAIMPVHCYGIPCDVDSIQRIADNYGLRVIYDAAHAFAVRNNGESILNHGDLSVLSFHATKVFNTFEGGAIICPNDKIKKRIDYLKNFGFIDELTVVAPGINGKMNEMQAAFGLLQLQYIDEAIGKRKAIYERYRHVLSGIKGLSFINYAESLNWNYAYCPIFIDERYFPLKRDELHHQLKKQEVFARRYFYPLISEFPMYKGLPSTASYNLPNALHVSSQVLCLPLYPDLRDDEFERIVNIIIRISQLKAL
ncbi:dTDP-4-amino-4,6-dideoxygalactose transaminase [Kosakonia arachidis]|uniref:dTDP-4-amino-4,6-dideoxygalactose transaminase n=1 Tax=Kosakonia arachidis TaxID=551989 RepID=A0A1I7E8Q9_9ENTR|nr:DegT/DnrJ/EryC1/StrS family aminotransferase [Kosakonia arachidis]SFU20314.1 dTDP-4-amino-4,6-dideoxygalactose transaminase [Kosakonia arachidis]